MKIKQIGVWIARKLRRLKARSITVFRKLCCRRFLKVTLYTFAVCGITIITSEFIILFKNSPFSRILTSKLAGYPLFQQLQKSHLYQRWKATTPGFKVATTITLLNLPATLMWLLPARKPWMMQHFAMSINNRNLSTLLLSKFSHDRLGFVMNIISVGIQVQKLIPQIAAERFFALYLCSGMIGGYLQHMWDLILDDPTYKFGSGPCYFGLIAFNFRLFPNQIYEYRFIPSEFTGIEYLIVEMVLEGVLGVLAFTPIAHFGGLATGSAYFEWLRRRNLIWDITGEDYLA